MLNDQDKSKLDGIVQQMTTNKESDQNIQAVVNDFKQKYGQQQTQSLSDSLWSGLANTGKAIGNALTSSEQAVGNDLTAGVRANMQSKIEDSAFANQTQTEKVLTDLIAKQKSEGKDTSHAEATLRSVRANSIAPKQGDFAAAVPESTKTNLQGLGDVAGVGLDVLSAGSYGDVVKGVQELAKTGSLVTDLSKSGALANKVVAPVAKEVVQKTLGQKLKDIGVKTAERAGIGAGTGYAYDVSQNLQQGKTGGDIAKPGFGTVIGGTLPVVIGGIQAGLALTKETAPRFINSLIKPKQADFSYGKDPGRTVSEMGITGNSLPDFANNIRTAKQDIGSQIGAIIASPENVTQKINANQAIAKFDTAITEAAKGGKSNQSIVTALQNAEDALLYEHNVNADGVIEKTGTTPRDLSSLSPQEAFDLKQLVSGQTKFTGNPSDDKTVNSVLKSVYGEIKDQINNAVGKNNPEITDLNQKYADLTSAEIATTHRDQIVRRADQVSLPIKIGTAGALISAIASGGATIPIILGGVTAGALEKGLESTAVKTRIASWLASQEPSAIAKVIQNNPGIKETLYRLVPKLSSQLGK